MRVPVLSGVRARSEKRKSIDGNGMRYEKTVNGITTNYYYDGTQLLIVEGTIEEFEKLFEDKIVRKYEE